MKRVFCFYIPFALVTMCATAQTSPIPYPITVQVPVQSWEDPAKIAFPAPPKMTVLPGSVWGPNSTKAYVFDTKTGVVTDAGGVEQPYTFEYAVVLGAYDRYGVRLLTIENPLQLVTRKSAVELVELVKKIAPDGGVTAGEDARPGPYGFSVVERYVTVYGERYNLGLIASTLMINGPAFGQTDLWFQFQLAKWKAKG